MNIDSTALFAAQHSKLEKDLCHARRFRRGGKRQNYSFVDRRAPMVSVDRAEKRVALSVAIGILLVLCGIPLLIGGWELAKRGETLYYLLAGLLITGAGVLLALKRIEALWVLIVFFLGTAVWSVAGVGLDGWKLLPRLLVPAILVLIGVLPVILRRPNSGLGMAHARRGAFGVAGAALIVLLLIPILGVTATLDRHENFLDVARSGPWSPVGTSVPPGDWPFYGRDQAATRFSPLTQITPANAARLQVAWTFRTSDLPTELEKKAGPENTFEATPTVVGGIAYLCTAHRNIIALDAANGRQLWRFVPPNDSTKGIISLACRGVAYARTAATGPCAARIIAGSNDGRLFALDARTGRPCQGFGRNGYLSLTNRMGESPPGFHYISSQPLVTRGKVIVGGWIYDGGSVDEPSGVVRAYDVVTGAPVWAWDLGRNPTNRPLAPGEKYTRGTPNMWATPSADEALGLVYLPLGVTTPDYFGAQRRTFDETYGTSVVALGIDDGRERWHFQTVHHDLWDLDMGAGPTLVDLPGRGGGSIPAMIQPTKRGEIFLLNRRTGQPIAGVVERPVPPSDVPGERSAPTQPYSAFPGVGPERRLTGDDIWGLTPFDQMLCRIDFARKRYEGQFTPPALGYGSIGYPAFYGVVDWQGVTLDPARRLMITNTSYVPFTFRLMPRAEAERQGVIKPWKGFGSGEPFPKNAPGWSAQYGTPYAIQLAPFVGKSGLPCTAPPWGSLVAIDYVKRAIAWRRPIGTMRNSPVPLPLPVGMSGMAGGITTASGLLFIGAFAEDKFRAIDTRTGKELWSADLPAGGQAIPATYIGRDGRQYVVISAGGHGGIHTTPGDHVIAFALPRSGGLGSAAARRP